MKPDGGDAYDEAVLVSAVVHTARSAEGAHIFVRTWKDLCIVVWAVSI
jgi:hypothetical protein